MWMEKKGLEKRASPSGKSSPPGWAGDWIQSLKGRPSPQVPRNENRSPTSSTAPGPRAGHLHAYPR